MLVGVGYTTLGQLIGYAIRLGSTLIITRLLAPDLFGLMAVGYTFTYAAALLSDVGLRSAIIQNQRADDPDYRDSVWMIIFMRGILIGLFVGGATVILWMFQRAGVFQIQSVYADPRILIVLPLLALAELVKGTESIEVLYRERKLDFKALFYFHTSKQIVNTVVTVIWAWLDPGVVALSSGSIAGNLFGVIISYTWLSRKPPKLVWRSDDFIYILKHGKWLLVSAGLTFLMNTVDRIYLAVGLDAYQLGIYSIATTLGLIAQELATKIGNSVVFPAMSQRIRDGAKDLRSDFYRIRRPFEFFALGCGLFLLAFGSDLVRLMYDSRYYAAGEVLRVFGVLCLTLAYSASTEAYLAMGEAKKNSTVYLARLIGLVLGLVILVPHMGVMGGAWALVCAGLFGVVTMLWCNMQLGLLAWGKEFRLLGFFALGLAAVALLEYLRHGTLAGLLLV
ncbi:MAG: oligosaccharide flippase family protein [Rubrivivax sp.]|nr:oligosaccharide flippase family protein [Rubrivivax sp.]